MAEKKPGPVRQIARALGVGLLGTCVAIASLATYYAASSAAAESRDRFDLAKLAKGQLVQGFRTEAIYLVASGKPVGARFKHVRSGFTFDFLSVQTAPQAFMWVNTPPTSDMGEAHTQEHLLLGKGNKGRSVATLEEMSMTSSSAMTMQWRTCYHFNTTAGADVFYEQISRRLDALLNPDYTDVEVAREVRNFGVSPSNPEEKGTVKPEEKGTFKLEEKGTVYNEMVSSVKSRDHALWRAQAATLYGKNHPLYYMSGGSPEGLRRLTPDHIRSFRKYHYVLHNMGMIAAVPKSMPPEDVLTHLDGILNGLGGEAVSPELLNKSDVPHFPPPQPVAGPEDRVEIVPYPEKDGQKPGTIELFWPAVLDLPADQEMLLRLFLGNLAGDPATPLYKKFIDRRTRLMDLGATGVWASVSDDQGFPISIGLSSVARDKINEKIITQVRQEVEEELSRIAAWDDASPELAAFNSRLRDRIIATRRSYGKFVNSPPGFGNRWQGSGWMGLFLTVGRGGDYYRSVTMKPELAFVEKELARKTNIWRDYLSRWKMTAKRPYAVATYPDPDLLVKEEEAGKKRLEDETARLKQQYGAKNDQEALAAYKADYDRDTRALEELAKHDQAAKLVKSLPLTDDDQLETRVSKIGTVPLVSSTFDSMTGATVGLALRADSIEPEDLLYASFLPTMINQVGVIVDGKPITYDQMLDLWRREILSVGCSYSTNSSTNRCELIIRGSGNDEVEADRAIVWMERLLKNPDWRPENLPRIRDVIDQSLTSLRSTRQSGYEESWVHSVGSAYWRQDWPLFLNLRCFLTRTHNARRLRWRLKGDGQAVSIDSFVDFMQKLSQEGPGATAEELKSLLSAMQESAGDGGKGESETAKSGHSDSAESRGKLPDRLKNLLAEFKTQPQAVSTLSADAAKDLAQELADIPDITLKHDWPVLCGEIAADIKIPPARTLERFDQVRRKLLTTGGARLFVIGAASTQSKMKDGLKNLLGSLGSEKFRSARYDGTPAILARLKERLPAGEKPLYIGFVNANTLQGVFLNSAPALKYNDLDEESLLDYLSFLQYSGGGAHSIFMKTWGAGLAYGNGLSASPGYRMSYYADKTPALPDTIKFVAEQLKNAPANVDLGDYAVAGAFSSMSAQSYESRGESFAESLVDGEPPDVVRRFRRAILALRDKPGLAANLHKRMLSQYGRVVPGLGVAGGDVTGAVYLVIGDEKQMKLYEDYLKLVAGPETKLYRIYGRDFWQLGKN